VNSETVLEITGLKTQFRTEQGIVRAVDGVSLSVPRGGTLGVVGESGCGKSVTALSVMQLLPRPKGRIVGGEVLYHRQDGTSVGITALDPHSDEMRAIRGNEIAMIFQEPMTSLNPVYSIGEQIMEAVRLHQAVGKAEAREIAIGVLGKVGIPAPEQLVDSYPHQFSGGMRQRAMIAIALSCHPGLLIADEPTTALDVTIEAQILALIKELQAELGMSLMIITHNLGVIGEMADQVVVMYMGKIVEEAPLAQLFNDPQHPYTQALFRSIPRIGRKDRLVPITGSVPNPYRIPKGCSFAPRCVHAMGICSVEEPPVFALAEGHHAKCWLYQGEGRVDQPALRRVPPALGPQAQAASGTASPGGEAIA
jgi:oligopeptide/dipeptide ABC transporter ATP-binding protein